MRWQNILQYNLHLKVSRINTSIMLNSHVHIKYINILCKIKLKRIENNCITWKLRVYEMGLTSCLSSIMDDSCGLSSSNSIMIFLIKKSFTDNWRQFNSLNTTNFMIYISNSLCGCKSWVSKCMQMICLF